MSKTYSRVTGLLKEDLKQGVTLRGLVRKTKLNSNTIANYLEGYTEPTLATLQKLEAAYGKPVAWLRGDTDDDTAPQYPNGETIKLASLSSEKRALWDAVDKMTSDEATRYLALVELLKPKN